ncbi:PREDICTED: uncharacterized protein LOC109583063 [Amphimedon queenslandica]|uniref:Uncharacterized protein n=1 Tax=Amphimedon queenslandica TaxID=400682 RepID=A0AAN0J9W4_AMPQE|nr:PREDICTED: uncharacterized protein LOC109583063 [Amphimedon queenslandica]|eukprot:XP_019853794.1 PREDICTED: uncharacterized protein LOC109583063 [Amphimedon queenslandica]
MALNVVLTVSRSLISTILQLMFTDTTTSYNNPISTATPSVSVTPSISDSSDSVIALGVSVGVLLILLTVSVTINICFFIRLKGYSTDSAKSIKHDTKADEDIVMQVCELYELHKTKQSEIVYDECEATS